jgi:hypothetical protein
MDHLHCKLSRKGYIITATHALQKGELERPDFSSSIEIEKLVLAFMLTK